MKGKIIMKNFNKQCGEVSLFVVIFATLLITVLTISFVRIMIQSQQQASAADLSQSAYDSAQVGVEDAKRAIIRYQTMCANGESDCLNSSKISSPDCNIAVSQLSDVEDEGGEIQVKTGSADTLAQAYTCVIINPQTENYLGVLGADASKFIPLVGASDFDTIKIDWFNSKDLPCNSDINGCTGAAFEVDVPVISIDKPLLQKNSWNDAAAPNRPSIMRAQLIEHINTDFSLTDFEGASESVDKGSNNTLFLYPSNIDGIPKFIFDESKKNKLNSSPTFVECSNSLAGGGYACSAIIPLPKPVTSKDRSVYLNLKSFYRQSNYKITLINNLSGNCGSASAAGCVKFDGVQISIDSTGRANDIFRRVQSRVEPTNNFPYPENAIDLKYNLCKVFGVTDKPEEFFGNTNCTP